MAHFLTPFKKPVLRGFALFLSCSLLLPSPAHALRKQQVEDSPLAAALLLSGLEEAGPYQAYRIPYTNTSAAPQDAPPSLQGKAVYSGFAFFDTAKSSQARGALVLLIDFQRFVNGHFPGNKHQQDRNYVEKMTQRFFFGKAPDIQAIVFYNAPERVTEGIGGLWAIYRFNKSFKSEQNWLVQKPLWAIPGSIRVPDQLTVSLQVEVSDLNTATVSVGSAAGLEENPPRPSRISRRTWLTGLVGMGVAGTVGPWLLDRWWNHVEFLPIEEIPALWKPFFSPPSPMSPMPYYPGGTTAQIDLTNPSARVVFSPEGKEIGQGSLSPDQIVYRVVDPRSGETLGAMALPQPGKSKGNDYGLPIIDRAGEISPLFPKGITFSGEAPEGRLQPFHSILERDSDNLPAKTELAGFVSRQKDGSGLLYGKDDQERPMAHLEPAYWLTAQPEGGKEQSALLGMGSVELKLENSGDPSQDVRRLEPVLSRLKPVSPQGLRAQFILTQRLLQKQAALGKFQNAIPPAKAAETSARLGFLPPEQLGQLENPEIRRLVWDAVAFSSPWYFAVREAAQRVSGPDGKTLEEDPATLRFVLAQMKEGWQEYQPGPRPVLPETEANLDEAMQKILLRLLDFQAIDSREAVERFFSGTDIAIRPGSDSFLYFEDSPSRYAPLVPRLFEESAVRGEMSEFHLRLHQAQLFQRLGYKTALVSLLPVELKTEDPEVKSLSHEWVLTARPPGDQNPWALYSYSSRFQQPLGPEVRPGVVEVASADLQKVFSAHPKGMVFFLGEYPFFQGGVKAGLAYEQGMAGAADPEGMRVRPDVRRMLRLAGEPFERDVLTLYQRLMESRFDEITRVNDIKVDTSKLGDRLSALPTLKAQYGVALSLLPSKFVSDLKIVRFVREIPNDSSTERVEFQDGKVVRVPRSGTRTAGRYLNREVTVTGGVDTPVHEMLHHWHMTLSPAGARMLGLGIDPAELFYDISWSQNSRPERRRLLRENGADRRDFFWWQVPASSPYLYGATNPYEDFAVAGESYVMAGAALRENARQTMRDGNFTPAIKYLFLKYLPLLDADGKSFEYQLSAASPGLSWDEVADPLRSLATQKNASWEHQRLWGLLVRIRELWQIEKESGKIVQRATEAPLIAAAGGSTPLTTGLEEDAEIQELVRRVSVIVPAGIQPVVGQPGKDRLGQFLLLEEARKLRTFIGRSKALQETKRRRATAPDEEPAPHQEVDTQSTKEILTRLEERAERAFSEQGPRSAEDLPLFSRYLIHLSGASSNVSLSYPGVQEKELADFARLYLDRENRQISPEIRRLLYGRMRQRAGRIGRWPWVREMTLWYFQDRFPRGAVQVLGGDSIELPDEVVGQAFDDIEAAIRNLPTYQDILKTAQPPVQLPASLGVGRGWVGAAPTPPKPAVPNRKGLSAGKKSRNDIANEWTKASAALVGALIRTAPSGVDSLVGKGTRIEVKQGRLWVQKSPIQQLIDWVENSGGNWHGFLVQEIDREEGKEIIRLVKTRALPAGSKSDDPAKISLLPEISEKLIDLAADTVFLTLLWKPLESAGLEEPGENGAEADFSSYFRRGRHGFQVVKPIVAPLSGVERFQKILRDPQADPRARDYAILALNRIFYNDTLNDLLALQMLVPAFIAASPASKNDPALAPYVSGVDQVMAIADGYKAKVNFFNGYRGLYVRTQVERALKNMVAIQDALRALEPVVADAAFVQITQNHVFSSTEKRYDQVFRETLEEAQKVVSDHLRLLESYSSAAGLEEPDTQSPVSPESSNAVRVWVQEAKPEETAPPSVRGKAVHFDYMNITSTRPGQVNGAVALLIDFDRFQQGLTPGTRRTLDYRAVHAYAHQVIRFLGNLPRVEAILFYNAPRKEVVISDLLRLQDREGLSQHWDWLMERPLWVLSEQPELSTNDLLVDVAVQVQDKFSAAVSFEPAARAAGLEENAKKKQLSKHDWRHQANERAVQPWHDASLELLDLLISYGGPDTTPTPPGAKGTVFKFENKRRWGDLTHESTLSQIREWVAGDAQRGLSVQFVPLSFFMLYPIQLQPPGQHDTTLGTVPGRLGKIRDFLRQIGKPSDNPFKWRRAGLEEADSGEEGWQVIPDGEAIAGSQLALRLVRYLTAAANELQHGFTVRLEGPGGSDEVIFRHPNDTDPKTTDARTIADWMGRFSVNMVEVLGKIGVDPKESSRLWRVEQLDDPRNSREVYLWITRAEETRLEVRPEELVVAWERFLGEVTQALETFHGPRWRRYRDQVEWLMANPSIPLSAVQQWEDEGEPPVEELPDYVMTLASVLLWMKEEVGRFIQIGEFSSAAEETSRAHTLLTYIVDGIRETAKEHEGPQEVLERNLKLEEGNAENYLASLSTIQAGVQSWQKRLERIASAGLEEPLGPNVSRRDFLKLGGAGAIKGTLGSETAAAGEVSAEAFAKIGWLIDLYKKWPAFQLAWSAVHQPAFPGAWTAEKIPLPKPEEFIRERAEAQAVIQALKEDHFLKKQFAAAEQAFRAALGELRAADPAVSPGVAHRAEGLLVALDRPDQFPLWAMTRTLPWLLQEEFQVKGLDPDRELQRAVGAGMSPEQYLADLAARYVAPDNRFREMIRFLQERGVPARLADLQQISQYQLELAHAQLMSREMQLTTNGLGFFQPADFLRREQKTRIEHVWQEKLRSLSERLKARFGPDFKNAETRIWPDPSNDVTLEQVLREREERSVSASLSARRSRLSEQVGNLFRERPRESIPEGVIRQEEARIRELPDDTLEGIDFDRYFAEVEQRHPELPAPDFEEPITRAVAVKRLPAPADPVLELAKKLADSVRDEPGALFIRRGLDNISVRWRAGAKGEWSRLERWERDSLENSGWLALVQHKRYVVGIDPGISAKEVLRHLRRGGFLWQQAPDEEGVVRWDIQRPRVIALPGPAEPAAGGSTPLSTGLEESAAGPADDEIQQWVQGVKSGTADEAKATSALLGWLDLPDSEPVSVSFLVHEPVDPEQSWFNQFRFFLEATENFDRRIARSERAHQVTRRILEEARRQQLDLSRGPVAFALVARLQTDLLGLTQHTRVVSLAVTDLVQVSVGAAVTQKLLASSRADAMARSRSEEKMDQVRGTVQRVTEVLQRAEDVKSSLRALLNRAGVREGPDWVNLAEFLSPDGSSPSAGLEEGRGFVLVEGVGMLAPPNLPAGRYYVVAIGIEQAAALIQAGRAPGRIIAVATGLEEVSGLAALGIPGDQIVRAWEWPTLEAAKNYAVRLGREWLAGLGGLQVSVLEVTARSLQGILAQLREMLPSAWQTARPITSEDARRALELSV